MCPRRVSAISTCTSSVAIRARRSRSTTSNDAVASVGFQASLANIDSVMVAGQWKKRDHAQFAKRPALFVLQA